MGSPLKIREDRSPAELRRLARREADGRVAARLYAIANALDRTSRAEAARLAGMERQTLRDAVLRYNTEDLAGLRDRPKGRPQRRLTEGEEAALAAVNLRGPEPDRDGCCAWTRGDLCRWMAAHFGKSYHPSSMTRVLRRMGFSRQKARAPRTRSTIRRPRIASKKRMARPVRKGFLRGDLTGLHQPIRSRSYRPGQDGGPRALVLIRGSASMRHFFDQGSRAPVRPSGHLAFTTRRFRLLRKASC